MSCHMNFYYRVSRSEKSIYKNPISSMDWIDQTEIIGLFGFSSSYGFRISIHFSRTRNSRTLNRLNQNDRVDRMSTTNLLHHVLGLLDIFT
jgi:hypothetical protein